MAETQDLSPEAVVQRQLDAYNARDLVAWLATYAEDACQYQHPATLLARGHAEIRQRAIARFAEPDLHARLLHRQVLGQVVIDHEMVRRNFAEGPGQIELLCLYTVEAGKISSASFVSGPVQLDQPQSR
ncbi:nuclear transport factor 2 family protein [Aquitalea sp. LB_tupeE]|uniref:nuclear transport factor 2 family protein n=1 Tax=Aquitalea sp. LB_tupeE TaxID=2748078 RepID=UPI0015C0739C|nr:nuclear transport factor 2 family protein [Aquitalea sp. LB_tupeE]NWK76816.1 nuclear transport factor 2 family protein [Aquitalea sp. LB_tupeE]